MGVIGKRIGRRLAWGSQADARNGGDGSGRDDRPPQDTEAFQRTRARVGYVSGVGSQQPEPDVELWASGFDIAVKAPHWVTMFPVASIEDVALGGSGGASASLVVTINRGGRVTHLVFQGGDTGAARELLLAAVDTVAAAAHRPLWRYHPLSLRLAITIGGLISVLAVLDIVI